jgi:hypothetical protein
VVLKANLASFSRVASQRRAADGAAAAAGLAMGGKVIITHPCISSIDNL